ncbi:MAG: hypothetical protein V4760_09450, partial [Bdellovibrionota bacterium]
RTGNALDSLRYARGMFMKTPAFTVFYLRWRLTNSDLGKKLASFDQRYQKKLAALFPNLSDAERIALQAIFHGLITSPVADEDAMKAALKWLPV